MSKGLEETRRDKCYNYKKEMKKSIKIVTISLFLVALVLVAVTSKKEEVALGSVADGQSYFSTTTAATPAFTSPVTLKSGSGSLANVVLQASAAASSIQLIDATTSDVTKRNNVATSSLILASWGNSPTIGTYTFDSTFSNGLLLTITGTPGTTTVTWR